MFYTPPSPGSTRARDRPAQPISDIRHRKNPLRPPGPSSPSTTETLHPPARFCSSQATCHRRSCRRRRRRRPTAAVRVAAALGAAAAAAVAVLALLAPPADAASTSTCFTSGGGGSGGATNGLAGFVHMCISLSPANTAVCTAGCSRNNPRTGFSKLDLLLNNEG